MFSTRPAISSPFTNLPLLGLEMHEVCLMGGPLGRNSDHKSCRGGKDLLFVPNETTVFSCPDDKIRSFFLSPTVGTFAALRQQKQIAAHIM